jgi:hypothetical protein
MSATDRFADAHCPPADSKRTSGTRAPITNHRKRRRDSLRKPSLGPGTLRWSCTQRQMKSVEEHVQRISNVPLLLG